MTEPIELPIRDQTRRKAKDLRFVGFPTFHNGEMFLQEADTGTIYVVEPRIFVDRRGAVCNPKLSRNFDVIIAEHDFVLEFVNGRLYAQTDDIRGTNLYQIDPVTGQASLILSGSVGNLVFSALEWDVKRYLAADDLTVYELQPNGNLNEHGSVEGDTDDDDPIPTDAVWRCIQMRTRMSFRRQAIVKDADGCLLFLDADGRLRLYGPDHRLARELGQLNIPDGAGRFAARCMSLDASRGLLYVFYASDVDSQSNPEAEYKLDLAIYAVMRRFRPVFVSLP